MLKLTQMLTLTQTLSVNKALQRVSEDEREFPSIQLESPSTTDQAAVHVTKCSPIKSGLQEEVSLPPPWRRLDWGSSTPIGCGPPPAKRYMRNGGEGAWSLLTRDVNKRLSWFAGVIIGIETVLHNRGSSAGQQFHQRMRRTCWFENSMENKSYTFFLRVFTLRSNHSQRPGKIGWCLRPVHKVRFASAVAFACYGDVVAIGPCG